MACVPLEVVQGRALPLTTDEWSVLVGSLLGDGCLRVPPHCTRPLYVETHCLKQEAYLRWKAEKLQRFAPRFWRSVSLSGWRGRPPYSRVHMCTGTAGAFWPLRQAFYPGGKKRLPVELLPLLTPLAVAIWYMDDGSFAPLYGRPSGNRIRSHVEIAVHCWTSEECGALGGRIQTMFGVTPTITSRGLLRLGADDSEIFLRALDPFAAPGMGYKFDPMGRVK